MKLSIRCKSCKKDIMIKDKVQNRFDLQQIYGDELSLRCNNCGTINKKHINRIWAEVSKGEWMLYAGVTIVVLIIVLLFVPVIWIKIGGFLPGAGLAALAQKKASDFNKTMIYRR